MDEIILINDAEMAFLNANLRGHMPQRFADALAYAHVDADVYAAGSGYFFKKELQHTFRRALEAKIPAPNAMMLFDTASEIQKGADSYVQRIEEPLGEAIIIANFAMDLPRVNVTQREEVKQIQWLGASYGYSVKDIAAARYANKPLNRTLGITARKIIERKHNRLAWFGDYEHNLDGILNNDDIPRVIMVNAIDSNSTPATIEDELMTVLNTTRTLTKTTSKITDLGLPPAEYAYIHSTSRSQDNNTTIAQFLLMANSWLERIHEVWELDADENGGTALALGWDRDSDGLRYEMVEQFSQLPVERNGLEFEVNTLGISGGANVRRPLEAFVAELVRS